MGCKNIAEKPEQTIRAAAAAVIDDAVSAAMRDESFAAETLLSLKDKSSVEISGKGEFKVDGKYCLNFLGNMKAEGTVSSPEANYSFNSKGNIVVGLLQGIPGEATQTDQDGKVLKSANGTCSAELGEGNAIQANCKVAVSDKKAGTSSHIEMQYKKDADGKALIEILLPKGRTLLAKVDYLNDEKSKARLTIK